MCSGIMEGANLSGDLERPQKVIWKGTLIAIGTSFLLYVLMIIVWFLPLPSPG